MCGIVGILGHSPVAPALYNSLVQLQHRGQDAAGILTADHRFHYHIERGLVRDIFNQDNIDTLEGNVGLGHVRYPTAGSHHLNETQPFWLGSPFGLAMAHNGQLTNYDELKAFLNKRHRHLNTDNDSEALIHLFANGLDQHVPNAPDFFKGLCDAVNQVFTIAKGSYSVVSCIIGKGLVAFRDPHGIRPLVMGERLEATGKKSVMFASETTTFFSQGYTPIGDVAPGEVVFVNEHGEIQRQTIVKKVFHPCIFEQVYFARPDAMLDDVSVYRARLRMGQNLANAWKARFGDLRPDIVVPVPFTSNTAALSFASQLDVRYSEGLYKNPFIGRTFIMSSDGLRQRSVRHKLTPQSTELKGKAVLLLDDSIVRGTTSREIVKMVKEAGATAVYLVSACPPVKYPCFYGIDIPTSEELIANRLTLEQLKNHLDVDQLLYQENQDLVEAVARRSDSHRRPCMACLTGEYPIPIAEHNEQETSKTTSLRPSS